MNYPVQIPEPAQRTIKFDPERLYAALDRRRRVLKISQREMMRQIGEPQSSALMRVGRGGSPSVDLLARMLVWLGNTELRPYLVKVNS